MSGSDRSGIGEREKFYQADNFRDETHSSFDSRIGQVGQESNEKKRAKLAVRVRSRWDLCTMTPEVAFKVDCFWRSCIALSIVYLRLPLQKWISSRLEERMIRIT